MLLWTACAVACSDSDPAPQPDDEGPTPPPDKEQQVVCGIEKPEEVAPAIARMLASEKPYLLDVAISPDQNVYPMVAPGAALDNVIGAIDVTLGAVRVNGKGVGKKDEKEGEE